MEPSLRRAADISGDVIPISGIEHRSVLESSPDAVLVLSAGGTISLVNAAAERMFGHSRADLIGADHRMLLAEDFRHGFLKVFDALLRSSPDTPLLPFEAFGLRADGSEFAGEVACSLFETSTGTYMTVTVRDTAHRKETDASLRQAMSLLTATLESTADGILVVSSDGQIAGLNDQFVSMWGIPGSCLIPTTTKP
ncbi:PAS domain-containing protein [Arthrobacter sp. SA17]